jgi:Ca2+-binding RTX toxin-like protein
VKGGTGNDTIITSGTLTADVSIAAGDGTDVLVVRGTPNISTIGALSGVETLDFKNLNGASPLTLTPTQFNAFTTIASTGGLVTNEKVVFSAAGTVTADVASKATLKSYDASALAGATTYNVLSGQVTNLTTVTLKGSTAALTDTLAFTGNNAVAVTAATNLAGIENISFANTSTTVAFTTGAATIGSGNGAAYTNPVTVTNVASSSTFKFDASGNTADRFNITNLAIGGKSSILGGGGVDTLVGAAGTDEITGGGGDDIITGAGGSDTLIGGAGNDTFIFNTGDVVSGETLVDKADNSSSTTDTIKVVTSTDFTGLATATILTNGAVEQILITSGQTATFNASQLTGQAINVNATGAGAATLEIKIPGNSQTVDFSTTALTFTAQTAPAAGNAFDTGVDIITITAAGTSDNITGTSIADSITTGGGSNVVDGKAGNDTIIGGAAIDSITGGAGGDTLTGNGGADVFRFDVRANITGAAGVNVDTITDFATTSDAINFGTTGSGSGATLLGLTLVPGTTTAGSFATAITDTTSVATIADVYTAIAANTAFSTAGNFAASAATASGVVAKIINFANGASAGQYLVVNDSTAAFQAANDVVIKVVGTVVAADLTFTV